MLTPAVPRSIVGACVAPPTRPNSRSRGSCGGIRPRPSGTGGRYSGIAASSASSSGGHTCCKASSWTFTVRGWGRGKCEPEVGAKKAGGGGVLRRKGGAAGGGPPPPGGGGGRGGEA